MPHRFVLFRHQLMILVIVAVQFMALRIAALVEKEFGLIKVFLLAGGAV